MMKLQYTVPISQQGSQPSQYQTLFAFGSFIIYNIYQDAPQVLMLLAC